jgi:hypothetical protein
MSKSYSVEEKDAMQARSQWDKRKLRAKALMDVVQGFEPDGDGVEYTTQYRIAFAAWREFQGIERTTWKVRKTRAFREYLQFFELIAQATLAARIRPVSIEPAGTRQKPMTRASRDHAAAEPKSEQQRGTEEEHRPNFCDSCEKKIPSGPDFCDDCLELQRQHPELLVAGEAEAEAPPPPVHGGCPPEAVSPSVLSDDDNFDWKAYDELFPREKDE